jgi:hypothetical protein
MPAGRRPRIDHQVRFVNPILVGDDEVRVAGRGRLLAERELERRFSVDHHGDCSHACLSAVRFDNNGE